MIVRLVREQEQPWDALLHDLDQATIEARNAENRRKDLQQKVAERLQKAQEKSHEVDSPTIAGEVLRVVYVSNQRVSVADDKVKAVLGRSFSKVRSDKVDREKLDQYLHDADEEIRSKLSECITITEHPSVRLYRVGKGESDG